MNAQRVPAVGAALALAHGGAVSDWARATAGLLAGLEQEYIARFVGDPLAGYAAWLEAARRKSARTLFEMLKISAPPDADEQIGAIQFKALSSCNAAFPGANFALEGLRRVGFQIHLASGNDSETLAAALVGAGLEPFVAMKFGPDLIDCAKEGAEYYQRIFQATSVNPKDALVVDDQPEALRWAMAAGARTIQAQVSRERRFSAVPGVSALLTDLRDLPALARELLE